MASKTQNLFCHVSTLIWLCTVPQSTAQSRNLSYEASDLLFVSTNQLVYPLTDLYDNLSPERCCLRPLTRLNLPTCQQCPEDTYLLTYSMEQGPS